MKLSRNLIGTAAAIIERARKHPDNDAVKQALDYTLALSQAAHLAASDGKTARSRALNKLADEVRVAVLRATARMAA